MLLWNCCAAAAMAASTAAAVHACCCCCSRAEEKRGTPDVVGESVGESDPAGDKGGEPELSISKDVLLLVWPEVEVGSGTCWSLSEQKRASKAVSMPEQERSGPLKPLLQAAEPTWPMVLKLGVGGDAGDTGASTCGSMPDMVVAVSLARATLLLSAAFAALSATSSSGMFRWL